MRPAASTDDWVDARSILNRTGGFLEGYTHTLNPYRGCSYGASACGVACYASELRHGEDRARRWGSYAWGKRDAAALYRAQAATERRAGRPLRIYMASVTDPYLPLERRLGVTRALLDAMIDEPPEVLTVQSHGPGPTRDLPRLRRLAERGVAVRVQISIETDLERLPGLPPHAYPPRRRLEALAEIRAAGLLAVCTVSPLLPLGDVDGFARAVERAADAAILDHFLLGDGSRDGARTRRARRHADRPLPELLHAHDLGEWAELPRFEEVVDVFRARLGAHRVGVSRAGFVAMADPALTRAALGG